MKLSALDKDARLYLLSGLILLAGLISAIGVYLGAGDDSGQLGYKDSHGSVYVIQPQHDKRFLHDLQLYGGKANVIFFKTLAWVKGLFQGQNLAYTIACLSAFVAVMIVLLGVYLPRYLPPANQEEDRADIWGDGKT